MRRCAFSASERGKVAPQRIGLRERFKQHCRHIGDKPHIEIAVEAAVWKQVDLCWKHQRCVVAANPHEPFLAQSDALAPV